MYAAHLSAGLAIKGLVWKAPTFALLIGATLMDLVWIFLTMAGIEKVSPQSFFDDWSHSFLMALLWASLFALPFLRKGKSVVAGMWVAVFSHFLLDMPIHPKGLALFPHSSIHLGSGLWGIGRLSYWLIESVVVAVLLSVYVYGARKQGLTPGRIAGACAVVLFFHSRFFW